MFAVRPKQTRHHEALLVKGIFHATAAPGVNGVIHEGTISAGSFFDC